MTTKQLVFFPTYNEAGNVALMLARISQAAPKADILIIDDNSPDGTPELLASCKRDRDNFKYLVRPRKLGIGTAHLLAWRYALHHDYDTLVTTDGDHTHDPAEIPMLLQKLNDSNDFVIGSRYIEGGHSDNAWYRRWLSQMANAAIRQLLQIKFGEFTTSYRAIRVNRLRELDFASLLVSGYSFFFLAMVHAHTRGLRIAEVPIHVHNRAMGSSKLTPLEVFRSMRDLVWLTINHHLIKATNVVDDERESCAVCGCEYSRMMLHVSTNSKMTSRGRQLMEYCLFCGERTFTIGSKSLHAPHSSHLYVDGDVRGDPTS
jgi:dolichol-phosphate mannosyltransferase